MNDKEKTRQIVELLRHRHSPPEWACFTELADGTGSVGGRMDVYAINLWPSKSRKKVAYEVKVSRADFAHELKDPRKRRFAETVADECYFAMPSGLVQNDEIPEGWGLMVLHKNGLKILKRARQRNIQDLPFGFVCSIARRSSEPKPKLPEMIWLHAGEELTEEQLLTTAREHMDRHIWEERHEAVEKFKQSREIAELYQMKNVIGQKLGLFTSLDTLRELLDNVGRGEVQIELTRQVLKRDLETLKLRIDKILPNL